MSRILLLLTESKMASKTRQATSFFSITPEPASPEAHRSQCRRSPVSGSRARFSFYRCGSCNRHARICIFFAEEKRTRSVEKKSRVRPFTQSFLLPRISSECIHRQHFAGVTGMFSPKPFLESRYVTVASCGLETIYFIATFAVTNRTSHAF